MLRLLIHPIHFILLRYKWSSQLQTVRQTLTADARSWLIYFFPHSSLFWLFLQHVQEDSLWDLFNRYPCGFCNFIFLIAFHSSAGMMMIMIRLLQQFSSELWWRSRVWHMYFSALFEVLCLYATGSSHKCEAFKMKQIFFFIKAPIISFNSRELQILAIIISWGLFKDMDSFTFEAPCATGFKLCGTIMGF